MTEKRRRPIELADSPEHRAIPIDSFDVEDSSDNTLILRGYASTFQPYDMYGGPSNGYGWIERIDRGAFERTLKESPDLHLLINHEGLPLARTKSGTLDLSVDDHGLYVVARLDRSDPDVQRLEPKMRRKDMDEMSFAFRVKGQKWESTPEFEDDPEALRTITEVSLHKGDVSVVNFGANPTTHAELDAVDRAIKMIAACDTRELAELRDGMRESTVRQALEVLEGLAAKPESIDEEEREDAPAETEDRADADDSPASLIAALDATLDEALKLTADVDRESLSEEVAQALDLLIGADAIVDKLMEISGVYDPDDDDADRANADETETREDAEDSEHRTGITIPVTAELTGVTGLSVFSEFASRLQECVDGLARALSGAGAVQVERDEDAAPESEERAEEESTDSDEARDEDPKGMSLRELRVLEGIVPDEGALSLAELRALEA